MIMAARSVYFTAFFFYLKGTVRVISSDSMQRGQCPIYNVTLKTFVFFRVQRISVCQPHKTHLKPGLSCKFKCVLCLHTYSLHLTQRTLELTQRTLEFSAEYKRGFISLNTHLCALNENLNKNENKQFKETKSLISSSYLIR